MLRKYIFISLTWFNGSILSFMSPWVLRRSLWQFRTNMWGSSNLRRSLHWKFNGGIVLSRRPPWSPILTCEPIILILLILCIFPLFIFTCETPFSSGYHNEPWGHLIVIACFYYCAPSITFLWLLCCSGIRSMLLDVIRSLVWFFFGLMLKKFSLVKIRRLRCWIWI